MRLRFLSWMPVSGSGFAQKSGQIFTGNVNIEATGDAVFGAYGTTGALLILGDHGGGTNLKYAHIAIDGGQLAVRLLNDDFSVKYQPMYWHSSGATVLGSWSTAQRPAGVEGMIGYNSDTDEMEIYKASAWHKITTTAV